MGDCWNRTYSGKGVPFFGNLYGKAGFFRHGGHQPFLTAAASLAGAGEPVFAIGLSLCPLPGQS